MTLHFVAALAWKSVICAGFCLLLLLVLRRRSAAQKSLVALAGVLALILLPASSFLIPSVAISTPQPVADAMSVAAGVFSAPGQVEAPPLMSRGGASADWSSALLTLYLAVALAFILGLAVALLRLRSIRSGAELLSDPHWLGALVAAQKRIGSKCGTALLTSSELCSPVSWGILRPTIIVDRGAALQSDRAEAIITHELAHVVRLDWLRLVLGRIAIALLWFNPLVWILVRQAHQLAEEAADDAVLQTNVQSSDYADLLVHAVRHAQSPMLLAANGVAPSRSSLGQRIAHVLDPSRPRGGAGFGWVAVCLVTALCFNTALAAAEPEISGRIGIDASAGERAAAVLAALPSAQARRIALAIRTDDWDARRVDGRTTFNDPAAIQPLLAALADDQPNVRAIAVWGLSEMRPSLDEEAAGSIAPLLADPSPLVRGQAARALADFGSIQSVGPIARLLRDPSPTVRVQAAHALGDLQAPASRPALEAATADPDPGVRSKVAWALREVEEAERILRRGG